MLVMAHRRAVARLELELHPVGPWQGGLLGVHRWWSRRRPPRASDMPWLAGNALTMLAVMLGWVLFRAKDLNCAWSIYCRDARIPWCPAVGRPRAGRSRPIGSGSSRSPQPSSTCRSSPVEWPRSGSTGPATWGRPTRPDNIDLRTLVRLRHGGRAPLQPRRRSLPLLPVLTHDSHLRHDHRLASRLGQGSPRLVRAHPGCRHDRPPAAGAWQGAVGPDDDRGAAPPGSRVGRSPPSSPGGQRPR